MDYEDFANQTVYRAVNIYILGLIEFNKEEIVLTSDNLDNISGKIREIVLALGGKDSECYNDSLYRLWIIEKREIFKCEETPEIDLMTLGYYHHRIILNIKLNMSGNDFENLRCIRSYFHKFFIDKISKQLDDFKICDSKNIEFIYSYPLVVIENGKDLVHRGERYDRTIFSWKTTSFFFGIPEMSWLWQKYHHIRVSIPCTFLYCDGDLGESFFWNLINAIYFGGLYKKKEKDRTKNKENGSEIPRKNEFDEEILVNLSEMIYEQVSTIQISETSMKLSLLAIILAIIAIIIDKL